MACNRFRCAMVLGILLSAETLFGQEIVNGGFESGLSGWSVDGYGSSWHAETVEQYGSLRPTEGRRFAALWADPEWFDPFRWLDSKVTISTPTFSASAGDWLLFDYCQPYMIPAAGAILRSQSTDEFIYLDQFGLHWTRMFYRFLSDSDQSLLFSVDTPGGMGGFLLVDNVQFLPGGSAQVAPLLPSNPQPSASGQWEFNEVAGSGRWFDPRPASAFLYQSEAPSHFTQVGLPTGLGDTDAMYTVFDFLHDPVQVAAGGLYTFPDPVTQFLVTGIDPSVDGDDPQSFPTYLKFDQSSVSFTMTPIPEPGSITLLVCGAMAGVICWCRRSNSLRRRPRVLHRGG